MEEVWTILVSVKNFEDDEKLVFVKTDKIHDFTPKDIFIPETNEEFQVPSDLCKIYSLVLLKKDGEAFRVRDHLDFPTEVGQFVLPFKVESPTPPTVYITIEVYVPPSIDSSSSKESESESESEESDPEPTSVSLEDEVEEPTPTWKSLIHYSEEFEKKVEFPTTNNRIKKIGKNESLQSDIERHAQNTRIIIYPTLHNLIEEFLRFKLAHGTKKEKSFYVGMTKEDFIARLFKKRPLIFYTSMDATRTRGNSRPSGKDWAYVGSDNERDLVLERYLSYDEIQIGALLGVSSPTFFINNGSRTNMSRNSKNVDQLESFGIYVGLVGARFEKDDYMESQYILAIKDVPLAGIGKKADPNHPKTIKMRMLAKYFGQCGTENIGRWPGEAFLKDPQTDTNLYYFPSFEELLELKKSEQLPNTFHYARSSFFNIPVYKKRIRISIETFLLEANARGAEYAKKVYVHVVGLGLGVWEYCSNQGKWMIEVYHEVIQDNPLPNISHIDFSWFSVSERKCGPAASGEILATENGNRIRIHFSKRDPADKLDDDLLLVASYAWDGNSFPGNEYWDGALAASGDPAAACCSTIPELQNPYVNRWFPKNIFTVSPSVAPEAEISFSTVETPESKVAEVPESTVDTTESIVVEIPESNVVEGPEPMAEISESTVETPESKVAEVPESTGETSESMAEIPANEIL
eukprot:TRINITY_DN631_c0_g1_i1.p1 TRINITY_DN631_c0_g1~~TRINITY_DN631_c0_g1_i1.p1  ORF type:complete len:692 (+),score=142.09 TRINITY_DN631_c0_g1_i1:64-2139(+)